MPMRAFAVLVIVAQTGGFLAPALCSHEHPRVAEACESRAPSVAAAQIVATPAPCETCQALLCRDAAQCAGIAAWFEPGPVASLMLDVTPVRVPEPAEAILIDSAPPPSPPPQA